MFFYVRSGQVFFLTRRNWNPQVQKLWPEYVALEISKWLACLPWYSLSLLALPPKRRTKSTAATWGAFQFPDPLENDAGPVAEVPSSPPSLVPFSLFLGHLRQELKCFWSWWWSFAKIFHSLPQPLHGPLLPSLLLSPTLSLAVNPAPLTDCSSHRLCRSSQEPVVTQSSLDDQLSLPCPAQPNQTNSDTEPHIRRWTAVAKFWTFIVAFFEILSVRLIDATWTPHKSNTQRMHEFNLVLYVKPLFTIHQSTKIYRVPKSSPKQRNGKTNDENARLRDLKSSTLETNNPRLSLIGNWSNHPVPWDIFFDFSRKYNTGVLYPGLDYGKFMFSVQCVFPLIVAWVKKPLRPPSLHRCKSVSCPALAMPHHELCGFLPSPN